MNARDWVRLLLLSLLWGATFILAAVALNGWPAGAGNGTNPLVLVWLRVVIAAAALFVALKALGVALPRGRVAWTAFFGMGLLNNVIPFMLIFWGQSQMPPTMAAGLASILNATTPLFTVIVMHVFTTDERATALKVAGVMLGLAGVAIMIGLDVLSGVGAGVWGQTACLLGALTYAFSSLYARRFKAMGITPLQTALGQLAASTAMMTLAVGATAALHQGRLPLPGAVPMLAIAVMAVFSTAVAYILFFQILASAGATNLMLVTFLIPVSAILLGVVILGEALKPQHILGMAFIGAGLAAIDGRAWRRLRNRPG